MTLQTFYWKTMTLWFSLCLKSSVLLPRRPDSLGARWQGPCTHGVTISFASASSLQLLGILGVMFTRLPSQAPPKHAHTVASGILHYVWATSASTVLAAEFKWTVRLQERGTTFWLHSAWLWGWGGRGGWSEFRVWGLGCPPRRRAAIHGL